MRVFAESKSALIRMMCALLLVLAALVAPGSPAAAAPSGEAKIEPRLAKQLSAGGNVTFWVMVDERADLAPAKRVANWNRRGQQVVDELRAVASKSQAGLRSVLKARGAKHRPFWIANAIRVTGNQALARELAGRPEVASVLATRTYQLPKPVPSDKGPQVAEWNIDRVRAPEVWSTFADRGEGIVVANIDTGVEFQHPALVRQYRGNLGDEGFDHNYSWFDPSEICGSPSLAPCDNNSHGTHTMGTMVGADADNEIGVAPNARWIAAKGCESNGCSDFALLTSGEWLLAPTDLNGQNPRVDLRPHIVNNSWGGGSGDPFYQAIVDSWNASGIFPAFANGNSGSGCGSANSPGDYPNTYAAGAFDINNTIADFSSRGASAFDDDVKPNIAAPGVDVRSSVPGGYDFFSGTSMASPHVAGTVALMWSAAPTLVGDVQATRAVLDASAVDTSDLQCGGTASDNNVWGEGRLDAFAAVDLSPRGPTGTLSGVVTDAATSEPIAGVRVTVEGTAIRTTTTGSDGAYSLQLPVGPYDVSTHRFGYIQQVVGRDITEGATTTADFALTRAPSHTLSGTVRDAAGNPLAGATVTIEDTPIAPATTGADGGYSFSNVPQGEYEIFAASGRCLGLQTKFVVVEADTTADFTLSARSDSFGYQCRIDTFDYIDATDPLFLTGDDTFTPVALPFPFELYGQPYQTAFVSTNGLVAFDEQGAAEFTNGSLPHPGPPNAAIYAFWDDLVVDSFDSVRTSVVGETPNRRFVVEWRDVGRFDNSAERVNFEIVLHENGDIVTQYAAIDANDNERGNSATVGIENSDGTDAFQYSLNETVLDSGLAVRYFSAPGAFVRGVVTDAVDSQPISGATVRALVDGSEIRTAITDNDGRYNVKLPLGSYTVAVSVEDYEPGSADVVLDEIGEVVTQDFALRSARAEISPDAFEFVLPAGATRTGSATLRNVGLGELTYNITESSVANATARRTESSSNTKTAPPGYVPRKASTISAGGPVLVFMDFFPWGSDALQQVLSANGIPFDLASSGQMDSVDMSAYDAVFIASDQPQEFYDEYNVRSARFADYVEAGGVLWVGAASNGFNGGDFSGGQLPGGAIVQGVFEFENRVVDPDHPLMQGVPDPFTGDFASHAAFANLPAGTAIIAKGASSDEPTLIEYDFGAGRVVAFGQTLEINFDPGADNLRILENGVPYVYGLDDDADVPWLSAEPASGTVAAGAAQQIQVTVDTTGLEPGLYRARLNVNTNDPKNPRLTVPVTLVVAAYQQSVNAGGSGYTDLAGDRWAADKKYAVGSFGFTNSSASKASTTRAISGTDDDKLFQSQRVSPVEYRFDGLPSGTYAVDLRFAEVKNTRPNSRLFDVIVEGALVLPAHDVAGEVGSFAADRHVLFVAVTDGQLNVRLVPRRGFGSPIINALQVTHRPDR